MVSADSRPTCKHINTIKYAYIGLDYTSGVFLIQLIKCVEQALDNLVMT